VTGLRFSVVTISFNQSEFLRTAIESVLTQRGDGVDVEYIICDPGSTDGSRDIAASYGTAIDQLVFAPDNGPADGLNRGFAHASGDIFCYVNSDDFFLPGAFAKVARYFSAQPDIDVITGHALVVDGRGNRLRRVWSEPYGRLTVALGAHVQIQPSTFIRAQAFRQTQGFDANDLSNWDGSLLDSLFLSGARLAVLDEFLSAYRLHANSITLSGRLAQMHAQSGDRRFVQLMGRPKRPSDRWLAMALKLLKHARWPLHTLERVRFGPLFRRSA
jgi:glycosyltransferase involved in cell wall biosynthesis